MFADLFVNQRRKIAPINGLANKRIVQSNWNVMVFTAHDFDHPLYNKNVAPHGDRQLPL